MVAGKHSESGQFGKAIFLSQGKAALDARNIFHYYV